MTKEELEKATGQELIEQRDYCGRDNYYRDYLDNVNAEMLKRFNRLAELEKENAILKGRTEGFEKQILGLLYKYESVYKRFPDLKDAMNKAEKVFKENAELKADYKVLSCSVGNFDELQEKLEGEQRKNNGLSDQLTKAKEIIKNLLILKKDHHGNTDIEWRVEVTEQAEQFLKEIEK